MIAGAMDLKQKAREWLTNYAANTADGPILNEAERLVDFAAQCVTEEREACAKIADTWLGSMYQLAKTIRARKDS